MDTSGFINFWSTLDRAVRSAAPQGYFISRWVELTVITAIFMFFMLLFMKWFGFCPQLRRTRREMQQHLYGIILHHRNPKMVFWSEMMMVWCNFKMLLWLTPTVIFGVVVFGAIYGAMVDRYGTDPLPVDRPILARSRADAVSNWRAEDAELASSSESLKVEAKVRVPAVATAWTRFRADAPGFYEIHSAGAVKATSAINVATPSRPPRPIQYANGIEIAVDYPPGRWWGMRHGWLVFFLLMCVITGIPIGRALKVKI